MCQLMIIECNLCKKTIESTLMLCKVGLTGYVCIISERSLITIENVNTVAIIDGILKMDMSAIVCSNKISIECVLCTLTKHQNIMSK